MPPLNCVHLFLLCATIITLTWALFASGHATSSLWLGRLSKPHTQSGSSRPCAQLTAHQWLRRVLASSAPQPPPESSGLGPDAVSRVWSVSHCVGGVGVELPPIPHSARPHCPDCDGAFVVKRLVGCPPSALCGGLRGCGYTGQSDRGHSVGLILAFAHR